MAYLQRAKQGEQLSFEWHARHSDGRLFWVEIAMRPISVGGADCIMVAIRDVDQRKQAESMRRYSI